MDEEEDEDDIWAKRKKRRKELNEEIFFQEAPGLKISKQREKNQKNTKVKKDDENKTKNNKGSLLSKSRKKKKTKAKKKREDDSDDEDDDDDDSIEELLRSSDDEDSSSGSESDGGEVGEIKKEGEDGKIISGGNIVELCDSSDESDDSDDGNENLNLSAVENAPEVRRIAEVQRKLERDRAEMARSSSSSRQKPQVIKLDDNFAQPEKLRDLSFSSSVDPAIDSVVNSYYDSADIAREMELEEEAKKSGKYKNETPGSIPKGVDAITIRFRINKQYFDRVVDPTKPLGDVMEELVKSEIKNTVFEDLQFEFDGDIIGKDFIPKDEDLDSEEIIDVLKKKR